MELTEYQIDELKEVGNIGAGNTSVALSKLIGKEISVEMTELKAVSLEDISVVTEDSVEELVGVLLDVKGDLRGHLLLLSPEKTSLVLVDMISGQEAGTSNSLSEMEMDGLKELGNILVGSYLAALADLSRLKIIEGLPNVIVDRRKNLIKDLLDKSSEKKTHALIVGTKLVIDEQDFEEEIVLMLEKESFGTLFSALSKIS